ncbi:DNA-directed RNA polymerase II subunit RPB1-like [Fundulus heteroclitus]|uniref:DNA-directed RNA polymerase II subunit RPB1-like n=1 Tax=Fundulus heteroclitus TaxID=8078 RepID=UPI00165B4956|nr:DNA-directed RNA polymerase II subunit RPB1-like [Fundulus heteroclitus]
MDVFLGLLLLSMLAAGGHRVNGDYSFVNKYGETLPVYRPVLEEPWFPVEPDFPNGGPVDSGYLPYRPKVSYQHHGYPPQSPELMQHKLQYQGNLGPFVPQCIHQHSDFLPKDPMVPQHPPQQLGGFPPQGLSVPQDPKGYWEHHHGYLQQVPTVFQYRSYTTEASQHYGPAKEPKVVRPGKHYPAYAPRGPSVPKQHPGYAPRGPSVPKQHPGYAPRGPSVPKQHPGYAPRGPSVPKQHPGYAPQGPWYPQQNTYSTKSPQRKRYFGKRKGKMNLPQKPYIAINRPRLFQRRHY